MSEVLPSTPKADPPFEAESTLIEALWLAAAAREMNDDVGGNLDGLR